MFPWYILQYFLNGSLDLFEIWNFCSYDSSWPPTKFSIKDLSTFSTISGSRNRTISKVSGSRIFFVHFYNFWIQKRQYFCGFWIQKQHHFYNLWIQKFVGQYLQFLDLEIAVFLQFLDPETSPFLQFLDHQMSLRECPSSSITHQWVRCCW